MSVFLGVDGGGTKTALCLVNGEGRILARARAPGCYYFAGGMDLVERVLRQGVDEVCRQAGIAPADIVHAFFGLPGYGEVSGDVPALDAAPGGALGHGRYACDNDMVCGWAGSLGGADGINVVSGTGSITYGERAGGGVRVGGWGELFGDEGSAYWISIRGLRAFSQMSDGRLPVGPLQICSASALASRQTSTSSTSFSTAGGASAARSPICARRSSRPPPRRHMRRRDSHRGRRGAGAHGRRSEAPPRVRGV